MAIDRFTASHAVTRVYVIDIILMCLPMDVTNIVVFVPVERLIAYI